MSEAWGVQCLTVIMLMMSTQVTSSMPLTGSANRRAFGEEGVEQRGEAAQVCVVDCGGTFVDTDHGVSGVGGMVGWHCDVRSGGDVVGQCGVGVGGAVELVEVPLGVCEQRCE